MLLFKLLIVTISASALTQAGHLLPDFECPSCNNPRDCYLPYPEDCKSFIQCTPDGRAYVMPCGPGTEWNDRIKVCDWPSQSTCNVNNGGFVCVVNGKEEKCMEPKNCLYPNPGNCNSFIKCKVNTDGISGTPVVKPCPAGKKWNDNKKKCVRPSQSTCKEPDDDNNGGFVCVLNDKKEKCMGPKDCLYPNPGNCNSFIQCTVNADGVSGTPVVMPCPESLEWNDNDKICDWPKHSTCHKPKYHQLK